MGHRASRDAISDAFWPGESSMGHGLHVLVHELRAALGDSGYVLFESPDYWLNGVDVDLDRFEAQIERAERACSGDIEDACGAYAEALNLYHGEFLPSDYEDWVVRRRAETQNLYIHAAVSLAELYLQDSAAARALQLAARAGGLDEAREDAARCEMRALSALGRRGEALRRYERLRRYLHREYRCDPDPATERLRAELLSPDPATIPRR